MLAVLLFFYFFFFWFVAFSFIYIRRLDENHVDMIIKQCSWCHINMYNTI